jgi:hypothetical protein
MRAIFSATPLLVAPVTAYAILAVALAGGLGHAHAHEALTRALVSFPTAGGGHWPVSAADLLLAAGLIVGFLDLLKGAKDRRTAIVNHALTITLFVVCLAAMLLAPAFATSTFFLLTLMVLLDLVAGFIVATAGPEEAEPRRRRGAKG